MAADGKKLPNLSKLSIALLEHYVEPILGSDAIQVIKSPVLEAELVASVNKALNHAEARFLREYPDDELTQIMLTMPFGDLPSFQAAVRSFVDRPTDPNLQEYLVQNILRENGHMAEERARVATGRYIRLVREELSVVSDSFRSKVIANAVLQEQENSAALVDRLDKILQILLKNPRAVLLDGRKAPEGEELQSVLKKLYEDKQARNQLVTRADLFCSLIRSRIDAVDHDKRPRVIAMLDDFEQRLNARSPRGKFEVTDSVQDLLAEACIRAKERGSDELGVVLLMAVLLEDPGENIIKGMSKHGFGPAEVLSGMRWLSVPDLF